MALEFLILTAGRSDEIREADWSEIDEEAATWTIPAARMKAELPHRVPLSTGAMTVLAAARALYGDTGLVFPAARAKGAMDGKLLRNLLTELEIPCVPAWLPYQLPDLGG